MENYQSKKFYMVIFIYILKNFSTNIQKWDLKLNEVNLRIKDCPSEADGLEDLLTPKCLAICRTNKPSKFFSTIPAKVLCKYHF